MEPWGWIFVYLVGFVLFQLLLLRYFADDRTFERVSLGSGESAPGSAETGQRGADGRQVGSGDGDDRTGDRDGVRCRHCGAINAEEQAITYCRECLGQLR